MIITCSPDTRHYKECEKHGGRMFYMPCWTLSELSLAGRHLYDKHHDELKVN